MTLTEKLAATYLRLNGFCLLSQFTVFDSRYHNHIDLIGIRAANSAEVVGGRNLAVDDDLFNAITSTVGTGKDAYIHLVAEVRSNDSRDSVEREHLIYASRFFGLGDDRSIAKLQFLNRDITIECDSDQVCVGLHYAGMWIRHRVREVDALGARSKSGSWTLSEDFLADFLSLNNLGLLADRKRPTGILIDGSE